MSYNHFCIFGRIPIIEALRAGKRFDKILLLKGISPSEEVSEIQTLARQQSIPLQSVPREKLADVAQKYSRHREANHQGVIGFLSIIEYYSIDDILHHIYAKGETPLLLILDGITDVGNFGAIARSAECFGAHGLIIPATGAAQINSTAMKASAGALNNILVCREKSLAMAVKYLRANGIRILGAESKEAVNIQKADLTLPTAVVLGAEGEGISKDILKLCDEKIGIVLKGLTESLNVSVAAGIILYEINRARNING